MIFKPDRRQFKNDFDNLTYSKASDGLQSSFCSNQFLKDASFIRFHLDLRAHYLYDIF